MICETVPEIKLNAPVISVNGAILASPDDFSEIRRGTIDTASMFEYMYNLYKTDKGVVGGHFYGGDNESYHFSALYGDEPDRDAFLASMPDKCLKMIILVTDEDSDRVTKLVEDQLSDRYHISRSWINGIEVVDKAFSKGQAAKFAKEYVGAEHLVCVGDYENDIDMIEAADIGYAVANAIPAVKAVADRITVSVHEHALAAIVRELEAEIDASQN
jgi:HAD superfamily hydrolase (TIGR01484 family)